MFDLCYATLYNMRWLRKEICFAFSILFLFDFNISHRSSPVVDITDGPTKKTSKLLNLKHFYAPQTSFVRAYRSHSVMVRQLQGWRNQLSVLSESYICCSGQVIFSSWPVRWQVKKNLISGCLKNTILFPKVAANTYTRRY